MCSTETVDEWGESARTRSGHRNTRRQLLRGGAGAIGTILGVTALGGQATAHFPDDLEIDVRPGSDRNPVTPHSRGVVPVAVLATDEFDPTTEAVRYRFGAPDVVGDGDGARPIRDGFPGDADGRDALVLFFRSHETEFGADDDTARLVWERSSSGDHGLAGTDSVTVVGRRGWWH